MRIVLDTNIYISSFIFGGNARVVFDSSFSEHPVFISAFILGEVERILIKKFELGKEQIERIKQVLLSQAIKIKTAGSKPDICRDKDDNNILWLAQNCKADLNVTGDKDLLTIVNFEGMKIIHPSEFIKSINN